MRPIKWRVRFTRPIMWAASDNANINLLKSCARVKYWYHFRELKHQQYERESGLIIIKPDVKLIMCLMHIGTTVYHIKGNPLK
jgi:hypothetical protein